MDRLNIKSKRRIRRNKPYKATPISNEINDEKYEE
jgi:hypothetical protein